MCCVHLCLQKRKTKQKMCWSNMRIGYAVCAIALYFVIVSLLMLQPAKHRYTVDCSYTGIPIYRQGYKSDERWCLYNGIHVSILLLLSASLIVMICMMIMTSDPRYAIGSLCGDIVFNATASIIMNDSSMSTVPVRSSSNTVAAVTPPHVNKRRKRYTFKRKLTYYIPIMM